MVDKVHFGPWQGLFPMFGSILRFKFTVSVIDFLVSSLLKYVTQDLKRRWF